MKSKTVNANSITDMDMMNARSQASMAAQLQRIGLAKRKKVITLSKNGQKYLEQMIIEMEKQMKIYEKQLPNLFQFFAYMKKELNVAKGKKREKEKSILVSFEEYDLLVKQMKDIIKGLEVEKSKLKWYSLMKKMVFSTMRKQTSNLLDELLKK
ncbi:viral A-type inclusion protein [Pseudostreptobacillus sp.]